MHDTRNRKYDIDIKEDKFARFTVLFSYQVWVCQESYCLPC